MLLLESYHVGQEIDINIADPDNMNEEDEPISGFITGLNPLKFRGFEYDDSFSSEEEENYKPRVLQYNSK